jgi:predicted transcriptional regulator
MKPKPKSSPSRERVVRAAHSSADIRHRLCGAINYDYRQKDLAKWLGVSMSYLSDFLSGKREVGPTILKKLGYEVKPYYILAAHRRTR